MKVNPVKSALVLAFALAAAALPAHAAHLGPADANASCMGRYSSGPGDRAGANQSAGGERATGQEKADFARDKAAPSDNPACPLNDGGV